ncbi:hypothetical protein LSAT2_001133 [Lamellibrachia satsuma]|nr:hypothetical protein LSAT2_001133 [Lamellibrachia satsuma]
MASVRLNTVVYLAKQQSLLGRTMMCRYSDKSAKKPPTSAADSAKPSPKPGKPLKLPTDKGTAKPPSTSQASTSAYKVEEYYTFTEYSYYDLDPNATKLRCPSLLGRTIICRYSSGSNSTKKPPNDAVDSRKPTSTPDKKLKLPTNNGTTKPAGSSDTSTYKNPGYFSFDKYAYYDMDTNLTKFRCPVPNKYK